MLLLFMDHEISANHKDVIRADIKKRTGEDCLILGPSFTNVLHIAVRKDGTIPQRKKLLQWFRK